MPGSDPPVLELRSCTRRRGTRVVVDAVHLAVSRGERVALLGPNGAGKSTLLRLAAGVDRPDSGAALVDGRDLATLRPRARARRVALCGQHMPDAGGWTARELVQLARTPHRPVGSLGRADHDAVDAALEAFGASAWAEQRVDRLSGGERRLVHLARAAAQCAPVLLLDEPLTHLDPANVARVLDALDELHRAGDRTIVAVLHEPSHALAWADRIVLLRDGCVVADHPPHDLDDACLQACFDTPLQLLRDARGAPVAAMVSRVARPG